MEKKIKIFDSTLRDGAQSNGISFTVEDKIKIVKDLDFMGISYIEAGNPGSNPKDAEFFERMKGIELKNSVLVAFGSTRHAGKKAEDDMNLRAILGAQTPAAAVFGKAWDFHVTDIIRTTLEENLSMIKDTIEFLKAHDKEVFFDAEHFFDGYKENSGYAIEVLKTAKAAGADHLSLCDTNGGCFPDEIYEITKKAVEELDMSIGIHCHNDCGVAVANSIFAIKAGADHVQGTFTGFGERCGNTCLTNVIGDLQVKMGIECIPAENLSMLTRMAAEISEIANCKLSKREPFVGKYAFAHKGGMHIDGVSKAPKSFEHINPDTVGNRRRFLTSEVSGKSTIISIIQKIAPHIKKDSEECQAVIDRLKEMEYLGYQYEGADQGFELLIRKTIGKYKPFFELETFKIISQYEAKARLTAEELEKETATAVIKVKVKGRSEITAAEGMGPVDALDKALRKALEVFYPQLSTVRLTDYKVRVLDSKAAAASKVRVVIESADEEDSWSTVGVSQDIIEASLIALTDSIEYKLIKEIEKLIQFY